MSCPQTWDGLSCVSATPAGELATLTCPKYLYQVSATGNTQLTCTCDYLRVCICMCALDELKCAGATPLVGELSIRTCTKSGLQVTKNIHVNVII